MSTPDNDDIKYAEFLKRKIDEMKAALPTATPEEKAKLETRLRVARVEREHIVGIDDPFKIDDVMGDLNK